MITACAQQFIRTDVISSQLSIDGKEEIDLAIMPTKFQNLRKQKKIRSIRPREFRKSGSGVQVPGQRLITGKGSEN